MYRRHASATPAGHHQSATPQNHICPAWNRGHVVLACQCADWRSLHSGHRHRQPHARPAAAADCCGRHIRLRICRHASKFCLRKSSRQLLLNSRIVGACLMPAFHMERANSYTQWTSTTSTGKQDPADLPQPWDQPLCSCTNLEGHVLARVMQDPPQSTQQTRCQNGASELLCPAGLCLCMFRWLTCVPFRDPLTPKF